MLGKVVVALAAVVAVGCSDDPQGGTGASAGKSDVGGGGTAGDGSGASGGMGSGASSGSAGDGGAGGSTGGSGGARPCMDEGLPLMPTPPPTLAETGLYQSDGTLEPYALHFAPQFVLWSDGATKERWAYIPDCDQIDTGDMDHWEMPVGARFWKEFTRDGVRIETRLIHRFGPEANEWLFAAYQWNPEQTSAAHVPMGVPDANGTGHDIPSEAQCKNCHTKLAERVLGFSAIQLSYGANAGDVDIASLSADGKLTVPLPDGFTVPGSADAQAALGYLHANCGNCHNDSGLVPVDMHLRLLVDDATVQDTDTWQTAVGKATTIFSCGGCSRIEPGFPDQSAIIQRMSVRGSSAQMPPIGSELVDDPGVQTVSAWIAGLPACASTGETCNDTIGCCGGACVNQTCVDACGTTGSSCNNGTECCTGNCDMAGQCACSGDFQPCATDADCCLNVPCDTANGFCL
jgi:hypothetical protein